MRILQLHNRYKEAGGEDTVVEAEGRLLRDHGDEVVLHSVDNAGLAGIFQPLRAGWQLPYSPQARGEIVGVLERLRPDVVHVHNFFPQLTPSVFDACRDVGVPVVQTLHNYRLLCPGAMLMRDGRPCEECLDGSAYRAVLYGCYRKSRAATLAVSRMVQHHRRKGTWNSKVDRYIALTRFARDKFVAGGLPAEKIAVKPNFVHDPVLFSEEGGSRKGGLFVGRLSQEKGVEVLIEAARTLSVPVAMLGGGPLLKKARQAKGVVAHGHQSKNEVGAAMRKAAFLVLPSLCYEGFPLVAAEAFAHGLPIIASRLGALAEIVREGETGLFFRPGDADDLAAKIAWMEEHQDACREMGARARQEYEERYTPRENYRQLMRIYLEVSHGKTALDQSGCRSPQQG